MTVIMAAVSRFRAIVMTTITTILGVILLIISQDTLFHTLAGILAFGLAAGTVLALAVAPALHTLFFRVKVPS
jgi:multidrug efflux pump subunit AcrB